MENKNMKEITKKIEGKEWETALDKAFQKANKTAKIDGFRPGHAPKEVFLKKYKKETLYMDAAELCLDTVYDQVLSENEGLHIVAQPDLRVNQVDESGVEFIFTLTLKPTVTLGQYTNLGVKKESAAVTKEEIDKTIDQMRARYTENIEKEGSIVEGDTATIDFVGSQDGVPFEGGSGSDYDLKIGSNTFIPGFEEQLIGMKTGEEKDINVTFPEDYHSEDLKGKPVVFHVTIHEVTEANIPELSKEFFEDLGMEGVTTPAELEKQVEENIKAHKDVDIENQYLDDLLASAAKNVEVDIPDVMIDEETNRMIGQFEENIKMQGLTLKQFYQFTNSNLDALKDQMKEEATNRVTYRLMLEAIAEKEKVVISDEDAEKESEVLAKKYEMERDEFLKLFGGLDMIKYDLQMRQAMDCLKK